MSTHAKLLSEVFDEKTVKLLQCLLRKEDIFYLRDLSRESGVSLATTHRIVQRLLKMGLVTKEVKDKIIYYQLLKSSPVFRELYSIIIGTTADPVTILKKDLKEQYGGKASIYTRKDGKQIFIISSEVKSDFLNDTCDAIHKVTGVKLNVLLISPNQFKQMRSMGLVS